MYVSWIHLDFDRFIKMIFTLNVIIVVYFGNYIKSKHFMPKTWFLSLKLENW